MCKKIAKRIKNRLKRAGGFSFTEMLAAVIILLIASEGMAQGIAFASRNFTKQMTNSEARILFSTLRETIDYELKTGSVQIVTDKGAYYEVTDFSGKTFQVAGTGRKFSSINGHICFESSMEICDIVSSAAYSTTYGMKAGFITTEAPTTVVTKMDLRYYDNYESSGTPSYYEYGLAVCDSDGNILISDIIQVIPLDASYQHAVITRPAGT